MQEHRFGGTWTDEKLDRLKQYLIQYRQIFTKNKQASYYKTWYVDAFAGTGTRANKTLGYSIFTVDPDESEVSAERNQYLDGSAKIALGLPSPFDKYLFIEDQAKKVRQLNHVIDSEFLELKNRIRVEKMDANEALTRWCNERDWKRERAVVFLDPFGSQVSWETVELLASTGGVDLWYLFPMITRMLTKSGVTDESWRTSLDRLFGTKEWEARFYKAVTRDTLFGSIDEIQKDATEDNIRSFIEERLGLIFPGVAKSRILRNSKSSPLYALCFAASSKKGHSTAVKIAQYLLDQ